MKTKSLFGIRFATNEQAKSLFLQQHFGRRSEGIQYFDEALISEVTEIGKAHGMSEQELAATMDAARSQLSSKTYAEMEKFFRNEGCQQYYITKPVLSISEKIKVKEPFDVEWLTQVPDGTRQLNFGSEFIRYQKSNSIIIALAGINEKGINDLPEYYSFFSMDLTAKQISEAQLVDDYEKDDEALLLDLEAGWRKRFFQLITFMELAPIEEITLPPGRKHGTKKAPDNLLNEQKFPITIVNSSWNRLIHREDAINVIGHLRKQAWGPNWSKRRLIYIPPFSYESYPIQPGKTRIQVGQGKRL